MKESGIVGVVLAGGESRRMGTNKALLPIDDIPMIQVVAGLLLDVFERVVVVADNRSEYEFLNLPIFTDVFKSSGPLGGIHSAFHHTQADALFVSACDTPFMTKELIHHVIGETSYPARVASFDGRVHPLPGLYRKEIVTELERSLSAGNRKLVDFLHRVGADIVPITPNLLFYHSSLLANVNEPGDYETVRRKRAPEKT
jgi:molybdopterin-guanine dinucleotide biosynthesis protein A